MPNIGEVMLQVRHSAILCYEKSCKLLHVLYSSSKKMRKLAIKTIYLVGRLDRYCLKAAQSVLEKASDN